MASLARSTRRAEGLRNHHKPPLAPRSGPPATAASLYHHEGRQKRGLEAPERDLEALRSKKARIAVEILARASPTDGLADIKARPPRPAPRQHPLVATSVGGSSNRPALQPASSPAIDVDPNLTKHQAKVFNGIKHELDRPQPEADGAKKQGRKLRSQEATRFKSELSAYFPDYDEVIGNDAKEQHLLTLDTPIVVVDSQCRRVVAPGPARVAPNPHQPTDIPVKGYGDSLFTDVYDSQRIDFGFLETQQNSRNIEDPLPDSLFKPVHKKAERLERSIRNSERGRAQHEKDQIIRLLEGLQGHDWLRVMGVSGVTETKKKSFEPARAHFIKGCLGILEKFRNWSLEEKRRKQEKERALADQAAEDEKRERPADQGQRLEQDARQEARRSARRDMEDMPSTSQDDAGEASSPAQQLREEAMAGSRVATPSATGSKRPRAPVRPTPSKPPEPPRVYKAFKSFFDKRHERDAAVNRNRRTGRKILAWGHALPEMAEADFFLPEEYRDQDMLKARERKKRRDKRG
ncbi:hypothetical protein OCS_04675 [Ophiocordyceps sinensis CO18]|nr:hypothetical protein OCS_04675 [Ophiocordyceps sinensis CO18]